MIQSLLWRQVIFSGVNSQSKVNPVSKQYVLMWFFSKSIANIAILYQKE